MYDEGQTIVYQDVQSNGGISFFIENEISHICSTSFFLKEMKKSKKWALIFGRDHYGTDVYVICDECDGGVEEEFKREKN